jgi:hypothetical protein
LVERLTREVLWLVAGVLLVDIVFAATYFLADLATSSDTAKAAFTVVWTLVTLGVVLRGLSRIRRMRTESRKIR